jgi:ribosomal protein L35
MTKNGKLLARRPGQNHFNSKERNATRQAKKGLSAIVLKNKQKSTFLPNA